MSFGGRISKRAGFGRAWRLGLLLVLSLGAAGLAGCGGKRIQVSLPPISQPTEPAATVETDDQTAVEDDSTAPDPALDPEGRPGLLTAILETAYSQLGAPYTWGGESPETGFDCSGFVRWVFEENGIDLPRSSRLQSEVGVPVERGDLRPGDLLFYSRKRGSRVIGHVGIYVGGDRFIHSPRRGRPIQEDDAFDAYRAATFLAARRMASDLDGDAPVELPEIAATAPGTDHAAQYYTVRKGDYIWALAKRFEVSPFELLKANGLKKDSILQIGQRLVIP